MVAQLLSIRPSSPKLAAGLLHVDRHDKGMERWFQRRAGPSRLCCQDHHQKKNTHLIIGCHGFHRMTAFGQGIHPATERHYNNINNRGFPLPVSQGLVHCSLWSSCKNANSGNSLRFPGRARTKQSGCSLMENPH